MCEILSEKFGVSKEAAQQSSKHFLHEFRKCPQHPSMDLNAWRQNLWFQALHPNYQKYCGKLMKESMNVSYPMF